MAAGNATGSPNRCATCGLEWGETRTFASVGVFPDVLGASGEAVWAETGELVNASQYSKAPNKKNAHKLLGRQATHRDWVVIGLVLIHRLAGLKLLAKAGHKHSNQA